jgi:hypothetical protein
VDVTSLTLASDSDPDAVALWDLIRRLAEINAGRSEEQAHPLIRQGLHLLQSRPDLLQSTTWVIATVVGGLAECIRTVEIVDLAAFDELVRNAKFVEGESK